MNDRRQPFRKSLWMRDPIRHDRCVLRVKSNCPAFALLEMLAIIAALVVLMALTVKPMRTLLADVPRSHRDFETWTQTVDMLKQLKSDVEHSERMLVFEMDPRISHNLLYLEGDDGLVSYSLTDDKVTRQSSVPNDSVQGVWELPHVKVDWQFWQEDSSPYAIEITTCTQRTVLNRIEQKFKQTHVYFQKTGSTKP